MWFQKVHLKYIFKNVNVSNVHKITYNSVRKNCHIARFKDSN